MKKITLSFFAILMSVLSWQGTAQVLPGSACDNPLVVTSLPFTDSGNTADYGNDYSGSDIPSAQAPDGIFNGTGSTSYLNGYDTVYEITPTTSGELTISTDLDTSTWHSIFVFTGCPFSTTMGYSTSTSGTSRLIEDLPVSAGETYYIVVSNWNVIDVNYTINIDGSATVAPLDDCENATAGILTTQDMSVCAGNSFTLEVGGDSDAAEGLTKQWMSSTDGQTWEAIQGATRSTYTVSNGILEETQFKYVVSCDLDSSSDETGVVTISLSPGMECYCTPTGSVNNGDEIRNFTLNNIDNDSAASEGLDGPGYSDYTEIVSPANLVPGEGYIASLTSGAGSGNHGAAIWIDYNDNGSFEASEKVAYLPSSIGANATVDFPEFIVENEPGLHRLRVQYAYSKNGIDLDPCVITTGYSETEDYMIDISTLDACANATAGTIITDDSICAGVSFTLEVDGDSDAADGLTRQWMSSTDGSTWDAIAGATGSSYIVSDGISEETQFKYVVSCTHDDSNAETDVIIIGLNPANECYCEPETNNTSYYLSSFSTSGGTQNINNNVSSAPAGGYGNYTDQTVAQVQTATIDFSGTINTSTTGMKIWVDWNQDGEFDIDELAYASSGYLATHSSSIVVPELALEGPTRMRVGTHYLSGTGPATPCEVSTSTYIGYQDYTFEIIALDDCANATAGTLVTLDMSVCAGVSFTLEVTGDSDPADGLTRQWMSSTDGSTWDAIAGATGSSYIVSDGISEETQYKYVVSCTHDNSNDETGVVTISMSPAAECYCDVSFPSDVEPITYVNFGDIDNNSDATVNGSPDLEDFTNQTASVNQGDNLPIEIKGNTDGNFTARIVVYIDWNQDGIFDDSIGSNEMYALPDIVNSTGTDATSSEGFIQVPVSALLGNTRMRVMKKFSTVPGPCNSAGYGQAEDYTITVSLSEDLDYVYENDTWTPENPSGVSNDTDNVMVINGTASLNDYTDVNNLIVMQDATLKINNVLNLHGDLTIDGDLVFVSNANGNGELGVVGGTITGDATVQSYMSAKRSYRMVSSAVTTSTTVYDNWQEGGVDTNTGFGTHITGDQDGNDGFDATATGNPSMFIVDYLADPIAFEAVTNTDQNTLDAGEPYLLFVRGDRSIDLTDNTSVGETVLRATGSLHVGSDTQDFTTVNGGDFAMFGNPYQSAVDVVSLFATGGSNVNNAYYYVYDPSEGTHGAYVTVTLPAGTGTGTSNANQYLQPGQGAQFATSGNGVSSLEFTEANKASGQFTTTSATDNRLSSDNMLTVQLFTTENFSNGGPTHDSFGIIFGDGLDNGITSADARKPMNFYENFGRDHNGTYLSIERREMPQPAEVYPLYSNGYSHADYTLKMIVDGLGETFLYLDDHYTGTSTLLEGGETAYTFSVDANDELSIATDRFSVRVEQRLGVDDNGLLAGVRLFPNPLNDNTFYINAPKLNGEQISVSISDLSGRQIFENMLDCRANTVTVSVNDNLASGVYMVTLRHAGEEHTYRLVKK